MAATSWVFLVLTGLLAAGLLGWGLRSLKRKRLLENVPTSKVKGVFLGLNEVKGRARRERLLTSYLAATPCVYYRYEIQERWERTTTERDHQGRTRTRTRSGWTTIDSDEERRPFELVDATGALRIVPEGAEIRADRVFDRHCGRADPLYYGKGPSRAVADSDHRRHFVEHAIPLDAPLYVMGAARLRDAKVEPEIARDRNAELFLISTQDERQLTRGYALAALFSLLCGTVAAFLFPVGFLLEEAVSFGAALEQQLPVALPLAGAYLGAVLVYYLTLVYNGLVAVRERREMAWSMIDVQLKRRHDLIPRLVACVKGYAAHEQETQRALAALRVEGARGKAVAGRSELAARQGHALARVFLLAESYPDLDADESFVRLQQELVDTEDRIAFAREFYNATVTALNNRLETLPDALLARLGAFRRGEFFAAQGFERTPVRVKLDE
ncbi:MAG: LemA family protein [Planctomycetota bacterium]